MKKKVISFFAGMLFMIVFGIIDNLGLILGMDINPFISATDDPLLSAMWGNTFSDFLGAVVGMIISYSFLKVFKVKPSENIFVEIVGVTIGCIIPIIFYVIIH